MRSHLGLNKAAGRQLKRAEQYNRQHHSNIMKCVSIDWNDESAVRNSTFRTCFHTVPS